MKKWILLSVVLGVLAYAALNTQYVKSFDDAPVATSDDKKIFHEFHVGDVHFRMPQYYLEAWGPKGESAKLRNVYYGQCLKRIDGRCGSPASSGPDYSEFYVYLSVPEPNVPLIDQIKAQNDKFKNDCESPEVIAAKSKVSIENPIVRYGVSCPVWSEYYGIIVRMDFNTGNFPRDEALKMDTHVTKFLDQYRVAPKGAK